MVEADIVAVTVVVGEPDVVVHEVGVKIWPIGVSSMVKLNIPLPLCTNTELCCIAMVRPKTVS